MQNNYTNKYPQLLAQLKEKDLDTYNHSIRVGKIARKFGLFINKYNENLYLGAMLHDVGKIKIDSNILKKNNKLTKDEYREIQMHVIYGTDILQKNRFPKQIIDIALYHHERVDGTGYFNYINIPYEARIVAIIDSYDAMVERDLYKDTISIPKALDEILKYSDKQFDGALAKKFIKFISLEYQNNKKGEGSEFKFS